jgi:hypothetical protein
MSRLDGSLVPSASWENQLLASKLQLLGSGTRAFSGVQDPRDSQGSRLDSVHQRAAKSSEEQLFGGEVVQRAPQDLTESGAFRFVRAIDFDFQDRRAGAGPGGRISGSPVRTCWRVTKKTAAVQVGNRSRPGTSSAASVGKKAQCHPNSSIRITAAAASSTASTGDKPPATKSGKATIWMASAAIATPQASRCLGDLIRLRKSNTLIMAFT